MVVHGRRAGRNLFPESLIFIMHYNEWTPFPLLLPLSKATQTVFEYRWSLFQVAHDLFTRRIIHVSGFVRSGLIPSLFRVITESWRNGWKYPSFWRCKSDSGGSIMHSVTNGQLDFAHRLNWCSQSCYLPTPEFILNICQWGCCDNTWQHEFPWEVVTG